MCFGSLSEHPPSRLPAEGGAGGGHRRPHDALEQTRAADRLAFAARDDSSNACQAPTGRLDPEGEFRSRSGPARDV